LSKKCPYPDKPCEDRYIQYSQGDVKKCRLDEWKRKFKVCPYDSRIRSSGVKKKVIDKNQSILISGVDSRE
jgi:hypothetical protein